MLSGDIDTQIYFQKLEAIAPEKWAACYKANREERRVTGEQKGHLFSEVL